MTVNFDLEVLSALIDTEVFGRDITILPLASQPDAPIGYAARGIWQSQPKVVILENGQQLATSTFHLGLRIRDFTVQPTQGDHVFIDGFEYVLDLPDLDGQGGIRWEVKGVDANQETPFLP
jgi:hypothetical protein